MGAGQIYQTLLRLYPSDYRVRFAVEMQNTFEQTAEARRLLGRTVFTRFLLGEFIGLLTSAAAEWIAKLTTDRSVRGRCLPDLRMMRPAGVPKEIWFAGARLSASHRSVPDEIVEAHARLSTSIHRTIHAIANHDFPGARRYSQEERQACDEVRRVREKYNIHDFEDDAYSPDTSR